MKTKSISDLITALALADAQFEKALDDRRRFDTEQFARRGAGVATTPALEAEDDAIGCAEAAGARAVDRALLALCKYRPKTQDELCRYAGTLFRHEVIQCGTLLDDGADRECAAAMLATISSSIVSLLFCQSPLVEQCG